MPDPKVLLCSDLHLGRVSSWLDGPEDVDRTAVGAWKRIVSHAIAGQATAVAIAGDIFDGVPAYYATRHAFLDGVRRLRDSGIPVIAVAGNHDWEALPMFARQFPDSGLTLLGAGGRWESYAFDGLSFVGWSFPAERHEARAFEAFAPLRSTGPVIGLVHGDVGLPTSYYHPINAADVSDHADAWAVGHVHKHRRIGGRAVYPGSPQALDFGPGEMGDHGFVWLNLATGGSKISDLVPVSTVMFHEGTFVIEAGDGESIREAIERVVSGYVDDLLRTGAASVQLRIRATLSGCNEKPDVLPTSPDPRCAWEFVDVRVRETRDPWAEAQGADAVAEIARLLIAAESEEGMHRGRAVDPEWIRASERLIRQAAVDAQEYWKRTVGRTLDHNGEAAAEPPDDAAAWAIARENLIGELGEMLSEVERRREEVNA